jgi:hypothetical protein
MDDSELQHQLVQFFEFHTLMELVNSFGEEKGEEYFIEFRGAFEKLFEKNESMLPDAVAKRDATNPIFVMALEETLQQENVTLEKLKKHVLSIYRAMTRQLVERYKSQVSSSQDKWKSIVESTKLGNQNLYESDYFDFEYVVDDENALCFDFKKCFYFDVFKANGRSDLGSILCDYDYILMDYVSEWSRF